MSMPWIKYEKGLTNKPEVVQLARRLGIDRYAVVGHLLAFWDWADSTTEDGLVAGLSLEDVDAIAGRAGFAEALCECQPKAWLLVHEDGLMIPAWDRHNGANAKRRAMATRRQQVYRDSNGLKPPKNAAWRKNA